MNVPIAFARPFAVLPGFAQLALKLKRALPVRSALMERYANELVDLRSELATAYRAISACGNFQQQMAAEMEKLTQAILNLRSDVSLLEHQTGNQSRWQEDVSRQVWDGGPPVAVPHESDRCVESSFEKLKALAPEAFAVWHGLLEVNARAYDGLPVDSCSIPGHPAGEKFRRFVHPYLFGHLLDIGCGPVPVPLYLNGYPNEYIAGIDPLPLSPHPFRCVQGVAEYLPWNDKTFSVVIAATSLDHVLLLDRAFAEIHRVLKPGGVFLAWVSFVDGSHLYDPYARDIHPVDRFHLFHFDRGWFEKIMDQHFLIEKVLDADGSSFFYSFRPRLTPLGQ